MGKEGKGKPGAKTAEVVIAELEATVGKRGIAEAKSLAEDKPDIVRLAMRYIASKKSLGAKQEALVAKLTAKDPAKGKQLVSFRQACMNQREASGIVGCRRKAAWRTADENRNDARLSCLAGETPPAFRSMA